MLPHRFIMACTFAVGGQFAHAQGYYVQAHGTYQLPIGGQSIVEVNAPVPPGGSPRVVRYERVNLNWGRGGGIGLTFGRTLNKHLGVELRSSWFPRTRTVWHSEVGYGIEDGSMEVRFLRIEPALRLSTRDSATAWYAAIGPSMALFPRSRYSVEQELTYPTYSTTNADGTDTYGGIGLGAFAAVGFAYRTRAGFGFFGEVNFTGQTWSPDRTDQTKYVFFDEDRLPTLSTSELITEYVSEYSTTENEDPSRPLKELRFHYPMSSWGVRVGVQYNVGRRRGS